MGVDGRSGRSLNYVLSLRSLSQSLSGGDFMQLGRKIRDLRLRRGLTVQQLAEATGLSKGFVSQVENGKSSVSEP